MRVRGLNSQTVLQDPSGALSTLTASFNICIPVAK